MIRAKYVRLESPAGTVANFQGITGKNHKLVWISMDLIKVLLDKGVKVYEFIPGESTEDPETHVITTTENSEILLTLENYEDSNGGKEFTENDVIVTDLEKERNVKLKEIEENNLNLRVKEIIELTEKTSEDYLADEDPDKNDKILKPYLREY